MNIGNKLEEWQGWGTCLKPSFEPIIVARKPFKGSLVDNVIQYGVGGINIDECRVEAEERTIPIYSTDKREDNTMFNLHPTIQHERKVTTQGRFPANTILTYDEDDFEEVCGNFPINNNNSTSRYFYCAKASKKDRDEGLEVFEEKINCDKNVECYSADVPFNRSANPKKNSHPTVKPTDLMQYLVRLVTPKNGTILDPFNGSGSTGKAVMYENKEHNKNYKYIGIELIEDYISISKSRIEYVINLEKREDEKVQNLFERLTSGKQ
jgi:site-specific DNA-methyltransferase (adenine-specific)